MAIAEKPIGNHSNILDRTMMRLMGNRPAKSRSAFEIHELIEQGLLYQDIITFIESIKLFNDKKIVFKVIGMSERTLYRRVKNPEPLSAEQSCRTWRFAETLTKAEDAQCWMNTPAMGLEGRKPIDLITTQVGYKLVDDFLTRINYGVYT